MGHIWCGEVTDIDSSDIEVLNSNNAEEFWKGVEKIGMLAFCGLDIEKLEIPSTVKKIKEGAFADCHNLKEIVIPETILELDLKTFSNCYNLKKVCMPKVKKIGESAFANCKELEYIEPIEDLEVIAYEAFKDCTKLKSFTFPKKLKKIAGCAFRSCQSLESIVFNDMLTEIPSGCFWDCASLKEIVIPKSIKRVGLGAFQDCIGLKSVVIPTTLENIFYDAFARTKLKYIYLCNDGTMRLTDEIDEKLESSAQRYDLNYDNFEKIKKINYRKNHANIVRLKQEGKLKFTPPNFMIQNFPAECFDNFLVNNNHGRWGRLVKQLKFDTLKDQVKENSLTDLFKIYYAIGGFSSSLAESEKAYKYIIDHVAIIKYNPNATPERVGAYIHRHFSKLELTGEFNPMFAQFFMKYYKDDPNFMNFSIRNQYGWYENQDYLCQSHNNFNTIVKNYPNRVVNGNEERALLTPLFVAEHSSFVEYDNVDEGNEGLAHLVGRYGYSKDQFEEIQEIYNKAKAIKDKYVICADKSNEEDCVTYRVLEKDDPLGFVLGDITNCCQHIGGAGEECVDDGYTNPDAGFLVFEESIKDENGNLTGETRILGQAYVWYDPVTKTVCYDNIEIPTKVLDELRKGEKHDKELSAGKLLKAVEDSAEGIIKAMNAKGIEVKRVTTGKGYNDLNKELSAKFKLEENPKAMHRSYSGYSDARSGQYIIKEYDDVTKYYKTQIQSTVTSAKQDIKEIENKGFKYKVKKILKSLGLLKNDNKSNQDQTEK